jgi:LysR family glycine cleavage system transcriptional activator
LDSAGSALRIVDASIEKIQSRRKALRVATLYPIGAHFVGPNLSTFAAAHPQIELDLSIHPVIGDLSDSDFDVALDIGVIDNIDGEVLVELESMVLCAPESVNGKAPPHSIEDLGGYTHLCYTHNPDLWDRVYRAFGQHRPRDISIKLINDGPLLWQMATQGLGVTIAARPFVDELIQSGALIDPFSYQFNTGDGIIMTHAPGCEDNADVAAFADWMRLLLPASYEKLKSSPF